jgi:YaiO family outer membrane protein
MNVRVVVPCILLVMLTMGFPRVSLSTPSFDYNRGMKEAKEAISSGDHTTAERLLAKLIRRYPENPELLAMHGRVLLWMKRYDEAHRTLKKAYERNRSASLLAEVHQAEAFSDIAAAEKLLQDGKTAEGEAVLSNVFQRGVVRYESGILLARSTFERGAFSEAATILAELLARYPKEKDLRLRYAQSLMNTGREWQALVYVDTLPERELDADLLALRARILFRTGDMRGAIRSFSTSLALRPDKNVAAEREKAETAQKLKKTEVLLAAGDNPETDAFLASLCDNQATRYDGCRRHAEFSSRVGNHGRAAAIYAQLAAEYPSEPDFKLLHAQELVHLQKLNEAGAVLDTYPDQNNSTLLSRRGGIAFNRKNNEEAISLLSRAVSVSNDPEIIRRLNAARTSRALDVAGRHMEQKEYAEAEVLLADLYKNSSDQYSSGLMLGKTLFAQRKYREASALYRELEQRYPKEPDLTALRVESHILAKEYREAVAVLREAPPAVQDYLAKEREDLLYRSTDNWFKVSGAVYGQSGRSSATETDLSLAVSQRVNQYSLTAWTGTMSKYSKTDTQIGLGVAGGKGEKSPFSWDVTFSASPEARILPRTTAGIEITHGFSGFDASIGFTRMDFKESSANIVVPGLLWYIPSSALTLSERFYFVPDTGGYSSLTTLNYEPDHRLRCFASFGAGTSAERISVSQDYQRLQTVSARIGAEYRYTTHYSVGAETSFESRGKLYDRTGATLYMRYWWQ